MLIDVLDKVANKKIPAGVHKYLHVDSRKAWVESVIYLVENANVKLDVRTLNTLTKNWESILYKKYSTLN
jgi:hypothetical protein